MRCAVKASLVEQRIFEVQLAAEKLVHFAVARGIVEDDPLAARQAFAQVDLDGEAGAPGAPGAGVATDLDVDRLRRDALVRCDRSEGEHNSTAQRSADQLDRAGVGPRRVVAAIDV